MFPLSANLVAYWQGQASMHIERLSPLPIFILCLPALVYVTRSGFLLRFSSDLRCFPTESTQRYVAYPRIMFPSRASVALSVRR